MTSVKLSSKLILGYIDLDLYLILAGFDAS